MCAFSLRATLLVAAYAYLCALQYDCLRARRARVDGVLRESAHVRRHLVGCPLDDPDCGVPVDRMALHAPGETSQSAYAGTESWFCAALALVPSPVGALASSVSVSTPLPDDVNWFTEQCECRLVRALPAWVQPWTTLAGHRVVRRVGEVVTGVTAEEVVQRAKESPLFFGVRGQQFLRWVAEGADGSAFYNEAFARVAERRHVGVVARNVWATKRVEGFFGKVSYSIVMNEYEYSTWSLGSCDCVPDERSLAWLTDLAADDLRRQIPAPLNTSLIG